MPKLDATPFATQLVLSYMAATPGNQTNYFELFLEARLFVILAPHVPEET